MSAVLIAVASLSLAQPVPSNAPLAEPRVQAEEVRLAQVSLRKKVRRSRCAWQKEIQGRRCWPNPGSHPKRRSSGERVEAVTRFADPQVQSSGQTAEPKRVRVPSEAKQPNVAQPSPEQPQTFWAWLLSFVL
ncbi:MAG: hypothetical protein AAF968_06255 [Pseudomonadota bacterium]